MLSILLSDKSSGKNIIWATDDYSIRGELYYKEANITIKVELQASDYPENYYENITSVGALEKKYASYGSYEVIQNSFTGRLDYIDKYYLVPVSNIPIEDRDSRLELWKSYRDSYMRYIKDDMS